MTEFRKSIAAAALIGFAAIATGFAAVPVPGAQQLEAAGAPAARIDAAFASLPAAVADPALLFATAGVKGDRLAPSSCAAQTWPNVPSACLVGTDGEARPPVRTVTIGYQLGEATTVLIRMPAPRIASR